MTSTGTRGAPLDPLDRAGPAAAWVTIGLLAYLVLLTAVQVLALLIDRLSPRRAVAGRVARLAARLGPRAVAGVAAAVLLSSATACRPSTQTPHTLAPNAPAAETVSMVLEADGTDAVTMELVTGPEIPPPLPSSEATEPAPGPAEGTPPTAAIGTVTVTRGDSFWVIAQREVSSRLGRAATAAETDPYWRILVETNRTRLVDPTDPDLIYPGQVLVVP